jgi:hypothetical protein
LFPLTIFAQANVAAQSEAFLTARASQKPDALV